MTRSRLTSPVGSMSLLQPAGCPRKGSRPLLMLVLSALLLALINSPTLLAQGFVESKEGGTTRGSAVTTKTMATAPAINWNTVWSVLGGAVIGAFGAWLWTRRVAKSESTAQPSTKVTPQVSTSSAPKALSQNVWKSSAGQAANSAVAVSTTESNTPSAAVISDIPKNVTALSLREVQGVPKPTDKSSSVSKKNKPNFNARSPIAEPPEVWPKLLLTPATSPITPPVPPVSNDKPLESGQTVDWAAPTTTPPVIQELIDSSSSNNTTDSVPLGGLSNEVKPAIQVGRDGWSIPPTKPYSYEEASDKTTE